MTNPNLNLFRMITEADHVRGEMEEEMHDLIALIDHHENLGNHEKANELRDEAINLHAEILWIKDRTERAALELKPQAKLN